MSVLFFHFDGTGNEPEDAFAPESADESITNVLKSHLLLGGGLQQDDGRLSVDRPYRSFYYAGIGTYGSLLERWLNTGFAFENADVAQILNRALLDFQCHYHANIKHIVLIGFSRGAALARRFAALISPFLDQAKVIEAVFDTVASIGLPNFNKGCYPKREVVFEHGSELPVCVSRALHMLALDEQRVVFRPTLMNHDDRVTEVWFPGVHSDVGGGYRQDGIADICFSTMAGWLQRCFNMHKPLYLTVSQLPLCNTEARSFQHWSRVLNMSPAAVAAVHYQSRLQHIARFTLAPRVCQVWRDNAPCSKTPPLWHRSVYKRMEQTPDYRPMARLPKKAICGVL